MQLTFLSLLGFLASSALASPQGPFGGSPPPPQNTTPPTATQDISIPLASILAAPVVDHAAENTTFIPVAGGSNSTLVDARPDLQDYVDNTILNTTTNTKRSLQKRFAHSEFCALPNNGIPLDQPTWGAIATLICKKWYPIAGKTDWNPSSPYPNTIHHSTQAIGLGGGQVVHVDFQYGVNDWNTQAAWQWSPFYIPATQSTCIADLTTLIDEMFNSAGCLPHTGYYTSGIKSDGVLLSSEIFDGTGQPQWYSFKSS